MALWCPKWGSVRRLIIGVTGLSQESGETQEEGGGVMEKASERVKENHSDAFRFTISQTCLSLRQRRSGRAWGKCRETLAESPQPARRRSGRDRASTPYVGARPHRRGGRSQTIGDTPLILAQALDHSGGFRAVVQAPSFVAADLRLDTEFVRLQQDFGVKPSRVQFTLRAQLIDVGARRVLAANRALGRLLERLATFCAETAAAR
jgi:hypothetical protein